MKTLYYLFLLGVVICLNSCAPFKKAQEKEPEKFIKKEYRIDYGGCSNSIEMELNKVGDRLYTNENGTLFFLTFDRSDESGEEVFPVFIQRFPNNCFDYIDIDTIVDFRDFDIGAFIDIETFAYEGDNTYKDKYRYYYVTPMAGGGHISKGKAHSFESLGNGFFLGSDGDIYIETLQLIKPPEEYTELFYRKVPVADVKTYVDLSDYYAKDKFNEYRDFATTDGRSIAIIEEADSGTFESIHYRLGKDKNHVFYNGEIIEELNVDSLTILCNEPNANYIVSYGLIKDNYNVYYEKYKMDSIDAKTFECICSDSIIIYQDENWVYDEDYFPSMNPDKRAKRK